MNDRKRAGPDRPLLSHLTIFLFSFIIVIFITRPASAEVCLDCHDEKAESLKGTTHEHPAVACASCHHGDEHADDPSTENITIPANEADVGQSATCTSCHQPHLEMDQVGFDPHQTQGMDCVSCHEVHGGNQKLLLDDSAEFCQKCHTETKTKFDRRSSHPVSSGPMTCLSCHRYTKRFGDNLAYDLDRTCQGCHPDQGGPFLHEHDATIAYGVEGGGCVECHEPHGAPNDHLLKQAGNQQCRQCHAEHITRNHDRLWDDVYSKLACQTCHTDLHGSMSNKHLLDPDLPIKLGGGDCYLSGCHSLTGL